MENARMKVHVVSWKTPLGPAISPYINVTGFVRALSYTRMAAALRYVDPSFRTCALDFGCWDGHFLPSLLNNFEEAWGIDDDSGSMVDSLHNVDTILQVARSLCESETRAVSRLRLVKASGVNLPFPDRYFEVVFCLDTLSHIAPPMRPRVIGELQRITRHKGQVLVSLPIEIGPILLLRQGMRNLTRKKRDNYGLLDLLKSACYRPARLLPTTREWTGKFYDFRQDLALLGKSFAIYRQRFVPINILGSLNPSLIVDCRRAD